MAAANRQIGITGASRQNIFGSRKLAFVISCIMIAVSGIVSARGLPAITDAAMKNSELLLSLIQEAERTGKYVGNTDHPQQNAE